MHSFYSFISGPLLWAAFIIFVTGNMYRLISFFILAKKKDPTVYSYMNPYYALRSLFHWLIPFGTVNMRKHPVMTLVTFIFHISFLVTPIFLFPHIILIYETWDISWWSIPDQLADIMTVLVILSCIYFLARRLVLPEVRFLTSYTDYLLLAVVALPFASGLWTYHQWFGYKITGLLHILSGELLLMAVPFTKLSHMILYPFIRGYTGSEFGIVDAKDW